MMLPRKGWFQEWDEGKPHVPPFAGDDPTGHQPSSYPVCDNSTLCTMVRITARLECALQPHSTSKPACLPIHTALFKAPFVTQLAKFALLHLLTFTSRGSLSGNCLKWPLKQDFLNFARKISHHGSMSADAFSSNRLYSRLPEGCF